MGPFPTTTTPATSPRTISGLMPVIGVRGEPSTGWKPVPLSPLRFGGTGFQPVRTGGTPVPPFPLSGLGGESGGRGRDEIPGPPPQELFPLTPNPSPSPSPAAATTWPLPPPAEY